MTLLKLRRLQCY